MRPGGGGAAHPVTRYPFLRKCSGKLSHSAPTAGSRKWLTKDQALVASGRLPDMNLQHETARQLLKAGTAH